MNILVFSVYDTKTQSYLAPFFAQTQAAAFRTCENSCKNPQAGFASNPADFTLFQIGQFDDQNVSAPLTPVNPAVNLGNFIQFMPKDVPSPRLAADTANAA